MTGTQPWHSRLLKSRVQQLRSTLRGLGWLTALFAVGWAGSASPTAPGLPAANVRGSAALLRSVEHSSLATVTPTVTLTPTVTVTPSIEERTVYFPLIQKQILVPGVLSIDEVYTTSFDGVRQRVFQPCQALALWIRLQNDAGIHQPATLFWETQGPEGQIHANVSARLQVNVPPGDSTWRFLAASDLDAPAGEYRFKTWFTSGVDRQELAGTFTLNGPPVATRYLEGFTGAIDSRNYDLVLGRGVVPPWTYVTRPVRVTDVFTTQDTHVVQSTLWEGVRRDTAILTQRYRPDGRPWGRANYGFRYYDRHPGCLRRHTVWWEIDEWMQQTLGRWSLEVSADAGQTWQGWLFFTLTD